MDIIKQEEKKATKIVEINDEKLAKLAEQERKWQADSEKYLTDQAKITSDNIAKYNEQESQATADFFNDKLIAAQKASDAEIAIKKKETDTKVQIEKQSLAAAASLAESFFAFQLNASEGNEAAQTAIKKKAFEVNKAFQLGQAIIDGARATLSAFASAPPGFKIAAAISAGVFAIAQIAKIASARFNPGSSGGGASLSPVSSSGGGSSTPSNPQLPQGNTQPQQSTTFDDKGNKTGGTNWISVKEINATQRSVNRVTEQSRF
jgi:hypothetical protein